MQFTAKNLICASFVGLSCLSGFDEINERFRAEKVALADVPPAVKATIQQESKGASVKGLVKAMAAGKSVYVASIVTSGSEEQVVIAEDGEILMRNSDRDAND